MIEVYGQSDDILVLDGAPYPADEIGCYNSNVMVSFSDGTVIEAGYPKYGKAVWWIQVRKKGTAQQTLTECDDEDAEIYSDIFLIDAELSRWEVMQKNKEDNNIPVMFYPQVEGITPTVVEPNTDCISRQYLVEKAVSWDKHFADGIRYVALTDILNAPSVTPQHTDAEIQKMQEMEQSEIQKAYELGKASVKPCEDAIIRQAYDKGFDDGLEEGLKVGACEDCISRQEAIDLADELKDDLPDDDHLSDMVMSHNEGILEYQTKLSLLPPVTLAEKVGHWEYTQYDGNPNIGNWHCSECRSIVNYKPTYNWEKKPYYKFCPNCGAKMEVEDGH